jgi:aminopeptidase N
MITVLSKGRRRGLATAVAATATAALMALPAGAAARGDTTGSAGLGDSFFAKSGNGGYDVSHYDVRLRYGPEKNVFQAGTRTTVSAQVTQPAGLDRFHLDYRGPHITDLRVIDGATLVEIPSDFSRDGQELIITTEELLGASDEFSVQVSYRGKPTEITDPDGSTEGWVRTDDGAFVVGEPRGTPAWMPANDHPTDKATFEISVRVPNGYKAVSNGVLDSVAESGPPARRTFKWVEDEPMATYLATATVGRFHVTQDPAPPYFEYYAVDKTLGDGGAVDRTADTIELFDDIVAPYPYSAIGGIVDSGGAGYALETQTRPIYPGPPSSGLVAHEMAHQWFGDHTTPEDWSDIWLNEGFATWMEWYWDEAEGGPTTAERLNDLCQLSGGSSSMNPPPASVPGPEEMFDNGVYQRGAGTLQSLRELIGDPDFFDVLAEWTGHDADDPVTTEDLIALVKAETGVPDTTIDEHFEDWAFDEGKPEGCSAIKSSSPSLPSALGVPDLSARR